MPRQLFTGILLLSLTLAACVSTLPQATIPPTPVQRQAAELSPARVSTATLPPSPLPSAEAGGNNPTAAPSTPGPVAFPDPSEYVWATIVSGLDLPTDIQNAGDGSGRLFILERPGRILSLKNGQLTPFLDLTDRVGSRGSEQGLLGLAFHPNFAENGFLYVNYTDREGNTHLARFTAQGNTADPASELQLLFVQQPFANHNGGGLAFGPEGYLYIGLGDGGSANDPYDNAQSLNTWLGKLLRIAVNSPDTPYRVPADNPFGDQPLRKCLKS